VSTASPTVQLRLEIPPAAPTGCARPHPCACRRCRPLTSRRTGSIQARILELLADGRQRTAASIALALGEGADTVARELRKLRRVERRLFCVAQVGGHQRAVWFLVAA
jgi:hypothetical protein